MGGRDREDRALAGRRPEKEDGALNEGHAPHPRPLPLGEGVWPRPLLGRPLSHGERDRVRGCNASSLRRKMNKAGGNAHGTTLGAGRRAGNSRAPGRESGSSRDSLVPPATQYTDALCRVRSECRWNYIGSRVRVPPGPWRMQMELHWSSQDAGSTPAGFARSWQVSSLSSPRLLLTASRTKRGLRAR